jgi:hypothetical protein
MSVELEMMNEENGRLRRHIKTLGVEMQRQSDLLEGYEYNHSLLVNILDAIATQLKGEPKAGSMHGWQDLPDVLKKKLDESWIEGYKHGAWANKPKTDVEGHPV